MTIVFWLSISTLTYIYLGYPMLVWVLAHLCGRDPVRQDVVPHVSLLIPAFNEEPHIEAKLRNSLALNYPSERLEIVVASDGSTDRTNAIVTSFAAQGVRLAVMSENIGKAAMLTSTVPDRDGEIVVFSDASSRLEPDALRQLVRNFADARVGCVSGLYRLGDPQDLRAQGEGLYWRYETWIKTLESHFGTVLGANGAIYAFHKEQYRPLPNRAIVDDFLVPMLMRLHGGGEIFFVPTARAYETSPEQVRHEFRRRMRIGAGDLQALIWTWRLLLPWKGIVALAYFSHKVLRWFGPWLMLTGFVANLCLLGNPVFQWLFFGQLVFYGLGSIADLVQHVPFLGLAASHVRYFIVLNAALLLGFVRLALGIQRAFWDRAPRRV